MIYMSCLRIINGTLSVTRNTIFPPKGLDTLFLLRITVFVSCMPKHFTESCRIAEAIIIQFHSEMFCTQNFLKSSYYISCLYVMIWPWCLVPGKHADYTPLSPRIFWHIQGNGELGKHKDDDLLSSEFFTVVRQDYFAWNPGFSYHKWLVAVTPKGLTPFSRESSTKDPPEACWGF